MIELCENIEFERIYIEFRDKVTRYVRGKIANEQDAEDVVSDVFVKVFNGLYGYDRKKSSVSTWIYTIAHNTVIDHYKTAKSVCELPGNLCSEDNIDEALLNEEALEDLANALERLTERERDIIILHYYSGKTLKNIAEKMNISYSYVKLMHANALKALRVIMNKGRFEGE